LAPLVHPRLRCPTPAAPRVSPLKRQSLRPRRQRCLRNGNSAYGRGDMALEIAIAPRKSQSGLPTRQIVPGNRDSASETVIAPADATIWPADATEGQRFASPSAAPSPSPRKNPSGG